jgi:hypothetical protein
MKRTVSIIFAISMLAPTFASSHPGGHSHGSHGSHSGTQADQSQCSYCVGLNSSNSDDLNSSNSDDLNSSNSDGLNSSNSDGLNSSNSDGLNSSKSDGSNWEAIAAGILLLWGLNYLTRDKTDKKQYLTDDTGGSTGRLYFLPHTDIDENLNPTVGAKIGIDF